jgi:hypothetical protein
VLTRGIGFVCQIKDGNSSEDKKWIRNINLNGAGTNTETWSTKYLPCVRNQQKKISAVKHKGQRAKGIS